MDVACVSPAFERPDLNLLLALLEEPLKAERSVLLLDIGADLGTYSVAVASACMPSAIFELWPSSHPSRRSRC
jgi:hypothetical protein